GTGTIIGEGPVASVGTFTFDGEGIIVGHFSQSRNGNLNHQSPTGTYTVNSNCTGRSEEHTSELQSRGHLVCRLLLEKKKKKDPQKLARDQTTLIPQSVRFLTRYLRDLYTLRVYSAGFLSIRLLHLELAISYFIPSCI